ncbi:MAG: 50S ribosomal protein L15 [Deltaproteobacteria bacterium]|nr:50S ribosomal protein L15 [Deltaproteobacteria bacterium]
MANELSNLHPSPGSTKTRMRVGRGEGSGKGKTCGRGTKGAQSRSGYKRRAGFEGGQMPLHRRLPKKGFTNIFAKDYETIAVGRLNELEAGMTVDAEVLKSFGMISRIGADGVKILGGGDLEVALHVRVAKLSKSAAEKILAAGGTTEAPSTEGE